MQAARIGLIGDFSAKITAHRAINESLRLAGANLPPQAAWVHTSSLEQPPALDSFHGIWCVPGSPYANTAGVLSAIQWARTGGIPFLGTCGGFQHAVLEFVRNVLGRLDAAHAELDPGASFAVIAPLACALVEKSERILATGQGCFAQWYGTTPRSEGFHCSYGLNPACESLLERNGLAVVARGENGETRAMELIGHRFFIGTLFQPERAAFGGVVHPVVGAFLQAAAQLAQETDPGSAGILPASC